MRYEFDADKIGKLVKVKDVPWNLPYRFEIITGYDFDAKQFLSHGIKDILPHVIFNYVSSDAETYTLDEAVYLLNASIKELEDKIATLYSCSIFDIDKKNRKENERNELSHLYNAYYECIHQIPELERHISNCKILRAHIPSWNTSYQKSNEYEIQCLQKEVKRTQKGIRRLKKRFYHYFGENAETVMEEAQKHRVSDIVLYINELKQKIANISKYRDKLVSYYTKDLFND